MGTMVVGAVRIALCGNIFAQNILIATKIVIPIITTAKIPTIGNIIAIAAARKEGNKINSARDCQKTP